MGLNQPIIVLNFCFVQEEHNAHLKEVGEIFDDDDFYQQLLRQFIEQKTSQPGSSDTMQDSIEMTRYTTCRTKYCHQFEP